MHRVTLAAARWEIELFNRLRSVGRYFSLAEPVTRWRISRGKCCYCDGRLFLSFGRSPFLTRCLSCRANIPNLTTIAAIKTWLGSRVGGDIRAHEFSSFGSTFKFMRESFVDFSFSEFFPEKQLGELYDGIRNEDMTKLTFADDSFDLVTSNGVLEHIPEDVAAICECFRILKPGGALIFTVPLYETPSTVHLAEISADGSIYWHGTPEYHDSRLGGPLSAATFWRHSFRDICARVKQCGFTSVDLAGVMLTPTQRVPDYAVVAVK